MLVEALSEDGIISKETAREVIKKAKGGKSTVEILTEGGYIGDSALCEYISRRFGFPKFEKHDPSLLRLMPKDEMEKGGFIPIQIKGETLHVAVFDPFAFNEKAVKDLGFKSVKVIVAPYKIIKEILDGLEPQETGEEAGTPSLLASILKEAEKAGASDVHIEPDEGMAKVRMRVDGFLEESTRLDGKIANMLISRVKVLSDMDISEKRLPQDGKFSFGKFDIRVSTMPTVSGEKAVLRLLEREGFRFSLESLGLFDFQIVEILSALRLKSGMIIVTGPTGSGKTTTLYSMLNKLDSSSLNISTVEDPVEYRIIGVNQVQVKPEIGLDFPKVLRHILRQDPDVIMVGEIRDTESADIAFKAALTGHLVLASIHANDTISTITRLLDMGIPRYSLASSITLIIAQRLLRILCVCKEEVIMKEPALEGIEEWKDTKTVRIFKPRGCRECRWTGYKGRTGIFEVLKMNDSLKLLILEGADERTLRERTGIFTLKGAIIKKVEEGITSLEEYFANIPIHLGEEVEAKEF